MEYWTGTILLGQNSLICQMGRLTIEDAIENWWIDLNLFDLAAVVGAHLRFRTRGLLAIQSIFAMQASGALA